MGDSTAVSKNLGLSTLDGAYTAQTSVAVPAAVVILKLTIFFKSTFVTFEMDTSTDFLANMSTPLSLKKFPKM